ncbi:MAG: hypothetical protein CVU38_01770 [Chloroflexi bacterium HGW-Chloroflexi-1]|nr:MAG: hypothetical protein CVU38_01770 [Chloroflexi bacterium HGW-Chloroflexi-1]
MRKLILVSHTHWDREWYQPFQEFRIRLVRFMDKLLAILEQDPDYRHFTLDGQTVVLEDYLEVRPDREAALRQQIRAGRLLVGPWYILPDEFLVGGEAIIRNLLRGHRIARDFGAVMKVGYLPDPFGQTGQMPQILKGFGIDTAVVWRGVPADAIRRSAFHWRSPDGSAVLAIFLVSNYCNAYRMPAAVEPFLDRLARLRATLEPYAVGDALLLMNGCDHEEAQPELPALIAAANARLSDAQVVHGTLPQYIAAVRAAADDLPTATGELRDSRRMQLLPGVLSTRMWIKQRNTACEQLLTRWAEPFLVWNTSVPMTPAVTTEALRSSQQLLGLAWKHLLQNQPHDSICGCSVDQVHRDMAARYDACEQIGEAVAGEGLQMIADRVRTTDQHNVVVFNPVSGPRTDWVEAWVPAPQGTRDVAMVDQTGRIAPLQVLGEKEKVLVSVSLDKESMREMMDWTRQGMVGGLDGGAITDWLLKQEGRTIHVEILVTPGARPNPEALRRAGAALSAWLADPQVKSFQVQIRHVPQAQVLFLANDVPGYGYKTYTIGPDLRSNVSGNPTQGPPPPAIRNEFYRVEAAADGALTVTDLETGTVYAGLNRFVDGGDAGDEYTYCPPAEDTLVGTAATSPTVEVIEAGPARFSLRIAQAYRLPAHLQADRQARSPQMVECPIVSTVSLYPGVPRIDIRTEVENRAGDHRLRVYFPLPFQVDHSCAEGNFDVVERPVAAPQGGPDWVEQPVGTHPQKEFVDAHDGRVGLLVANRGLPEYEIVDDAAPWGIGQAIALTLLRSVGWLSRDDLATRPRACGPVIPTPEAQCLGRHVFAYALAPHAGDWRAVFPQARAFNSPLRAVAVEAQAGDLPPAASFLEIEPASLTLSALKPAEDGQGSILRFWNTAEELVEGRLRLGLPWQRAWRANLDEEHLEELPADADGWLHLAVRGREIVSLRFV